MNQIEIEFCEFFTLSAENLKIYRSCRSYNFLTKKMKINHDENQLSFLKSVIINKKDKLSNNR